MVNFTSTATPTFVCCLLLFFEIESRMALLLSALVYIVSSQQVPQSTSPRQNQAILLNVNQASSLGPGIYSASSQTGPYQIAQDTSSAPYQSYAIAAQTNAMYPYQTSASSSIYQASANLYAASPNQAKSSITADASVAKTSSSLLTDKSTVDLARGQNLNQNLYSQQRATPLATPPANQRSMSPFYRGVPRGRAINQPYVRRSPQLTPQQQQQALQQAQQMQRSGSQSTTSTTAQPTSTPVPSAPTPAPYGPPAPQVFGSLCNE